MRIEWPLRLKSLNSMLRKSILWGIAKKQRSEATIRVANAIQERGSPPSPPWVVSLTRICKRPLDDDSVPPAFKHVRDGIADALGVDDGNKKMVRWEYMEQITGAKEYGIVIEIETRS